MLTWALIFFAVAMIAAAFGFGGHCCGCRVDCQAPVLHLLVAGSRGICRAGCAWQDTCLMTTGKGRGSVTKRSSIVAGAAWMVVISLVLFFLPAINGLIAGAVGGHKVGSVGRALLASVLPALVLASCLWLLLAVFQLPFVGLLAGFAVGTLIVVSDLGLFVGAAIGGAISPRQ